MHSSDAVDQLETISEHTEPECEDSKELNGKYENGDIKVCKANLERENEDAMLDKPALEMTDEPVNSLKIPPVVTSAAKDDGEEVRCDTLKSAMALRTGVRWILPGGGSGIAKVCGEVMTM